MVDVIQNFIPTKDLAPQNLYGSKSSHTRKDDFDKYLPKNERPPHKEDKLSPEPKNKLKETSETAENSSDRDVDRFSDEGSQKTEHAPDKSQNQTDSGDTSLANQQDNYSETNGTALQSDFLDITFGQNNQDIAQNGITQTAAALEGDLQTSLVNTDLVDEVTENNFGLAVQKLVAQGSSHQGDETQNPSDQNNIEELNFIDPSNLKFGASQAVGASEPPQQQAQILKPLDTLAVGSNLPNKPNTQSGTNLLEGDAEAINTAGLDLEGGDDTTSFKLFEKSALQSNSQSSEGLKPSLLQTQFLAQNTQGGLQNFEHSALTGHSDLALSNIITGQSQTSQLALNSGGLASGLQNTSQVPLSSLAAHIASQAQNGNRRFDIRLDPPELGRIEVRLDLLRDGGVNTHIVVERSETLDLMQRDSRALEKALNDAGLDLKDGNLNFSLKDQGFAENSSEDTDGSISSHDSENDEDHNSLIDNEKSTKIYLPDGSLSGLDIRV